MIIAKCIKESDKYHKHDLEVEEEYEVNYISMCQSHTSILLKDKEEIYNSVIFKFYENGNELDIYHDKRFNPYL